MKLEVLPATPERWSDLQAIFGARGCSAARGCRCMFYRRSGRVPALPAGVSQGRAHRAELKAPVDAGRVPGLIGYRGKSDDELWFGTQAMYDRAGFDEVARRKPARPVVRLALDAS